MIHTIDTITASIYFKIYEDESKINLLTDEDLSIEKLQEVWQEIVEEDNKLTNNEDVVKGFNLQKNSHAKFLIENELYSNVIKKENKSFLSSECQSLVKKTSALCISIFVLFLITLFSFNTFLIKLSIMSYLEWKIDSRTL